MIWRHCRVIACKSIERDAVAPLHVVTVRTIDGDVYEICADAAEYEAARRSLEGRRPLVLALTEESV